LFSGCIGPILHVVNLCRPVLREVPGLGRSICRAAGVVRSVKLVHQPIDPGEAGMCFWPWLSQYVSAARCLLDYLMVHLAPTLLMEAAIITVPAAFDPSA